MRGVSWIRLRCRLRVVERDRARGLHHQLGAPRFGDHGLALTEAATVRATLPAPERPAGPPRAGRTTARIKRRPRRALRGGAASELCPPPERPRARAPARMRDWLRN